MTNRSVESSTTTRSTAGRTLVDGRREGRRIREVARSLTKQHEPARVGGVAVVCATVAALRASVARRCRHLPVEAALGDRGACDPRPKACGHGDRQRRAADVPASRSDPCGPAAGRPTDAGDSGGSAAQTQIWQLRQAGGASERQDQDASPSGGTSGSAGPDARAADTARSSSLSWNGLLTTVASMARISASCSLTNRISAVQMMTGT